MNSLPNNPFNPIVATDSYKASHWKQYPEGTTKIYSYLESRGGRFPATVFFGLQYILRTYLSGPIITRAKIDFAQSFWNAHFGKDVFNREGWDYILDKYNGHLPIRIKAVKEGSVVPTGNVLMTIENLDEKCWWLTNWLETLLMQVWYPITVATHSYECKKIIRQYLLDTAGSADSLPFKLHDFGFRGVSSYESSAIGSAAHLVNFKGTDTVTGILLAMDTYGAEEMVGFSVPASEHSTITSWGRDGEKAAYENMLKIYPDGTFACVIDSYDVYNAAGSIWGGLLRESVLNRNGVVVLRPDSGDPVEVNSRLIDILWKEFPGTYKNGYKVLDDHIRIIQGDGIDLATITEILHMYKQKGFSAENIAFGSGGALLQKFDRDTQKFAIKCSYAEIGGIGHDVFKDPVTQSGKASKKGQLKLHYSGGKFSTISSSNTPGSQYNGYIDSLVTVFENGEMHNAQTFDEIRERTEAHIQREVPALNETAKV